jgi:hypothetical protein
MDRRRLAVGLLATLLLTGCGGGDDEGAKPDDDRSVEAPAGSPDGVGHISAADEHAIKKNLTAWFLEPRCDLATDEYLIRVTPFADEDATVEEACDQWTKGFVKPSYDEDDIVYSNLRGSGDRATIEVGSAFANVTTVYEMTFVEGMWKVSGDDFNDDDLRPLAEVA